MTLSFLLLCTVQGYANPVLDVLEFVSRSQWYTDATMSEPWLGYGPNDPVITPRGFRVYETNPFFQTENVRGREGVEQAKIYAEMVMHVERTITAQLGDLWGTAFMIGKVLWHADVIKFNNRWREAEGWGPMIVVAHRVTF